MRDVGILLFCSDYLAPSVIRNNSEPDVCMCDYNTGTLFNFHFDTAAVGTRCWIVNGSKEGRAEIKICQKNRQLLDPSA